MWPDIVCVKLHGHRQSISTINKSFRMTGGDLESMQNMALGENVVHYQIVKQMKL